MTPTARRPRTLLALLVVLAGTACDDPQGPSAGTVLRPASISFFDLDPAITLPDSAVAGVPVEVTVESYGDGCTELADTEVAASGLAPVLRPLVRVPAPGAEVVCPSVLRTLVHRVSLTFPTPGTATITVEGRRDPERTVQVESRPLRVVAAP